VKRCASLIVAAVAAIGSSGCQKNQGDGAAFHPLHVGTVVPAYAIASLTGDTVRMGPGEKPTVLNVWATWCTSCREEMAALDSLNREFGPRGARVVGVSVDEGSTNLVRRFTESNHLGFTIAHDQPGDIQRTYSVVGVPTTFLIGRDGRLLWMHTGNIVDTFAETRAAVEKAVASGS
jgi:peroxiredoxin